MATLTLRISDPMHDELKQFAKQQKMSLNRMFELWVSHLLAEQSARKRFDMYAARGSAKRGIELLDEIDQHFKNSDA